MSRSPECRPLSGFKQTIGKTAKEGEHEVREDPKGSSTSPHTTWPMSISIRMLVKSTNFILAIASEPEENQEIEGLLKR